MSVNDKNQEAAKNWLDPKSQAHGNNDKTKKQRKLRRCDNDWRTQKRDKTTQQSICIEAIAVIFQSAIKQGCEIRATRLMSGRAARLLLILLFNQTAIEQIEQAIEKKTISTSYTVVHKK